MQLQTIIDTVRYGDLCSISWEDPARIPQIISYLNLALIDLYKGFPIKEKQVAIQQFSQTSIYVLSREYARTNIESDVPHRYILDNDYEPFIDDVLIITGACDELGRPVPLNDNHDPRSWFLSGYNQIQIPEAKDNETAFLIYRCKPVFISPTITDFSIDIELPDYLLEAVCSYIAFKAMLSMGGQEGMAASEIFHKNYLDHCKEVDIRNLLNQNSSVSNIKPGIRGYV